MNIFDGEHEKLIRIAIVDKDTDARTDATSIELVGHIVTQCE